mmetsp:Transcript_53653/g.141200  ORF Transcript_53653/g.141200 Transcript_53653/m.141200 type:complete len:90 (+) Transcript_53653:1191-1460(+)
MAPEEVHVLSCFDEEESLTTCTSLRYVRAETCEVEALGSKHAGVAWGSFAESSLIESSLTVAFPRSAAARCAASSNAAAATHSLLSAHA